MSRECEIVRILQSRVAAGDATAEERQQIDAHLRNCNACGRRRAVLRQKGDEVRNHEALPSESGTAAAPPTGPRPVWQYPALLAAASVLIASVWLLATRDDALQREAVRSMQARGTTAPSTVDVAASLPSSEPETEQIRAESTPDDAPSLDAILEYVPPNEPLPEQAAAREPLREQAAAREPLREPGPAALSTADTEAMRRAGNCSGLEAAGDAATNASVRAERLLAAGTCKLAAGDPEGALALFDTILEELKQTPSAAAAMFERGAACEAAGRPGTAVGAYASYRRDHPNAPRAAEALLRLCRLHLVGGRLDQAIACTQRFRSRYPNDDRVAETHYFEGLALKETEETLVQAAESFARYAGGSDTEHLDDALYWRAFCLRQAQDAAQTDAARAYLERLPTGRRAAEVRAWLGD